jgi:hypothetical protein
LARAARISIRLMERLFIFKHLIPDQAKPEPCRTGKTLFYRGEKMAQYTEYIATLADASKFYYSDSELMELCTAFEVDLSYHLLSGVPHLAWVRSLIQYIDHGNNRRFLQVLASSLLSRAREGVARTGYEKRTHHQSMVDLLTSLEEELREGGIPSELTVPEKNPVTAGSEARDFLGKAETEITIVDNRVGINTLACLRDVNQHIRIVTGQQSNSLEDNFERALQDFKSEGHAIDVRRHPKLQDRFILFNNRCWVAGSSLKDAGEKAFNVIELIDSKAPIYAEVTRKWEESVPLELP